MCTPTCSITYPPPSSPETFIASIGYSIESTGLCDLLVIFQPQTSCVAHSSVHVQGPGSLGGCLGDLGTWETGRAPGDLGPGGVVARYHHGRGGGARASSGISGSVPGPLSVSILTTRFYPRPIFDVGARLKGVKTTVERGRPRRCNRTAGRRGCVLRRARSHRQRSN